MAIVVNDTTPRNQYTATSAQTTFTYSFEIFEVTDIKVFQGSTLLTYASSPSDKTEYRVTGAGTSGGGTIVLGGGATASDIYTLVRDIPVARTTDFPTSGPFVIDSLNTDLDKMVAMMGEREDEIARSIRLTDDDASATLTLPLKASRANKVLTFGSTGNVETSITAVDVTTVAGISSNITTLSGIASNVTTVAGISSNVTTVAGKSSEITSVAAVASLITSDFVSDLNTLAVTDVVNDINTLATSDIVSDLNTLATSDIVSDLNTLATSDIVSDINTLATSDIVSDLNTLATSDFVSDLNTIATSTNVTNIATVAGNNSNINTVAGINANITTVAGISSNVTTVAGITSNIGTVAGIASDITTVAGNNTNITTLAGISSDVTSLVSALASTTNYAVTVASGTLYGGGSGNVFYLDGTGNPAITLIRGNTYVFDQSDSSNATHPIAFRTSADASYTTGVTSTGTPGNAGAKTTFVVPSDAPASLKYYCTSHGNGMGNVITVETSNINVVASNIGEVNSFAQRYRVASSDPTASLDEGDLVYNSTANVLKYYNGSAWVTIVAGSLTDIVQDGSPQLGGNLDVQTNSIVSTSNRDINITPDGSGKVVLDGLSYPVSDGTANQAITTDGSGTLTFSTIQASELTTVGNLFSNYNSVSSNTTSTTASTKNAFLFGPITVSGSATWTIDGNGTLAIL
tara:strand:- start:58 stop:2133 length:2076 start_codon:yes stop_codon:yes gene_type:complete